MKISCEKCDAKYNVDDARIPPSGIKIKCPKCMTLFVVKKPEPEAASLDLPALPDLAAPPVMPPDSGAPAPAAGYKTSMGLPFPSGRPATAPMPREPGFPSVPAMSPMPPTPPGFDMSGFGDVSLDDGSASAGAPAQEFDAGPAQYRLRKRGGEAGPLQDKESVVQALTDRMISADDDVALGADGRFLPLRAHPDFKEIVALLGDEALDLPLIG